MIMKKLDQHPDFLSYKFNSKKKDRYDKKKAQKLPVCTLQKLKGKQI